MCAYLVFGSSEYVRDKFFGAFGELEKAEEKVRDLRTDSVSCWCHTLFIDIGWLHDGSVTEGEPIYTEF